MSAPVLAPHPGGHCAPRSPLAQAFRRVLRMPRRKPASLDAAPVAPRLATHPAPRHAETLPRRQGWAPITQEPPRPETEPARAWDDGIIDGPLVPGYMPPPVYGERCQRDVAEAERLAKEMRL